MTPNKRFRFASTWNQPIIEWAVFPLVSLMFQCLFLLILTFLGSMLLLGTPPHFWSWPSGMPKGQSLEVIRMWMLAFGLLFGLVWWGYLRLAMYSVSKIPAFPLHLLAAWLPIIAILCLCNPVNNPNAMIPAYKGEVIFQTSLLMLAAVLFPLYLVAVYRFVLLPPVGKANKAVRLVALGLLCSAVCLLLLPVIWRIVPILYHGIDTFPAH